MRAPRPKRERPPRLAILRGMATVLKARPLQLILAGLFGLAGPLFLILRLAAANAFTEATEVAMVGLALLAVAPIILLTVTQLWVSVIALGA